MPHAETKWVLVTSASSGLGVQFAATLAARGFNLVLAARREEPMQQLAAQLRQRHGVEIVVEARNETTRQYQAKGSGQQFWLFAVLSG
jgi:short-subunit dehydrogenase